MLRKRTRSVEKDQQKANLPKISDSGAEPYHLYSKNPKSNPLFSVPGLFIGFNHKGLSDSDSVRSPTSPLELRLSSNLGNPLRSPNSTHQRSWNTSKVGLSIIDTLDDDTKSSGTVLRSKSKNILFGPRMRIKNPNCQSHIDSFQAPRSLPENYAVFPYTHLSSASQKGNSDVVFEIGDTPLEPEPFGKIRSRSLDSCKPFPGLASFANSSLRLGPGSSGFGNLASQFGSPPQFVGGIPNLNNSSSKRLDPMSVSVNSVDELTETLSTSDIELSENYTRVISHGPNPKTTHIYDDHILDCDTKSLSDLGRNEAKEVDLGSSSSSTTAYHSCNFLNFCYSCNKKLEGRDIYIYRGEKAFCSLDCRLQEMLIDEETEKTMNNKSSLENSPNPYVCGEEFSKTSIFIAT